MRLPEGEEAGRFTEFRFKAGAWERHGVPEQGCRVRPETLDRILSQGGHCEVDELIYELMAWLDVTDDPEPALRTLRQMLDRHYPDDGRITARCRFLDEFGVDRVFHVGPVDRATNIVSWQRKEWVIAIAQPAEEQGRMIVGAPAPISLEVAQRILSLSTLRFMDEPFNSFEGAQTTSRSTGSYYSWEAGSVTTISWEYGLGLTLENGALKFCSDQVALPPSEGWIAPNQLVQMVAIAAGYLS